MTLITKIKLGIPMQKYDLSVVIGRFQPVHNGHIELISKAIDLANKTLVIIGSDNRPPTPRNPFSSSERIRFIKNNFDDSIDFEAVEDSLYNDVLWETQIQNLVEMHLPKRWSDLPYKVCIVGHSKDHTSSYLNKFPQWDYINIDLVGNYHSTYIRNSLFECNFSDIKNSLDLETFNNMLEYSCGDKFKNTKLEYDFIKNHNKMWSGTPYPVSFNTVDSLVVQSGHVLVVKRRAYPGKGLYALPGGYLNMKESMIDGAIRELREETKLKIATRTLQTCIKKRETFDHPLRSERGRIITTVFLFELGGDSLPKVKGSDDAEKALWMPVGEIYEKKKLFFEDHIDIITHMLGDM